ncbi:uncharacterized protein CLUP02_15286 [Colletotrichum lupini]|uniref:Uncharacterized protein n=1 Tax=Colletotrichum lupini TaxID=145971 RepID=A0A9Q8T6K4_9PEZI|nr:uncharacterized protein CLUP02_15286 [Colletotrichum lupini]UQC89755.1 hypothetical protein CLUP02_15286 [Colletotrichum lupini]
MFSPFSPYLALSLSLFPIQTPRPATPAHHGVAWRVASTGILCLVSRVTTETPARHTKQHCLWRRLVPESLHHSQWLDRSQLRAIPLIHQETLLCRLFCLPPLTPNREEAPHLGRAEAFRRRRCLALPSPALQVGPSWAKQMENLQTTGGCLCGLIRIPRCHPTNLDISDMAAGQTLTGSIHTCFAPTECCCVAPDVPTLLTEIAYANFASLDETLESMQHSLPASSVKRLDVSVNDRSLGKGVLMDFRSGWYTEYARRSDSQPVADATSRLRIDQSLIDLRSVDVQPGTRHSGTRTEMQKHSQGRRRHPPLDIETSSVPYYVCLEPWVVRLRCSRRGPYCGARYEFSKPCSILSHPPRSATLKLYVFFAVNTGHSRASFGAKSQCARCPLTDPRPSASPDEENLRRAG